MGTMRGAKGDGRSFLCHAADMLVISVFAR